MARHRWVAILVILAAAALLAPSWMVAQVASPDGPAAPGPDGRGGPDARGGPDGRGPPPSPEERMTAQLQTVLGADAETWNLLQPKIEHIQLLLRQRERVTHPHPKPPPPPARAEDPNAPPPPPPPPPPEAELTPDMIAASSLTDVGRDPGRDMRPGTVNDDLLKAYFHLAAVAASASPAATDVENAIQQFHQALENSNSELAAARKELRQLVNVQQEAILIVTGILD